MALKSVEDGIVAKDIKLLLDNKSCTVSPNVLAVLNNDEENERAYHGKRGEEMSIVFMGNPEDTRDRVSCPFAKEIAEVHNHNTEVVNKSWAASKKTREIKPTNDKLLVRTNRGTCLFSHKQTIQEPTDVSGWHYSVERVVEQLDDAAAEQLLSRHVEVGGKK